MACGGDLIGQAPCGWASTIVAFLCRASTARQPQPAHGRASGLSPVRIDIVAGRDQPYDVLDHVERCATIEGSIPGEQPFPGQGIAVADDREQSAVQAYKQGRKLPFRRSFLDAECATEQSRCGRLADADDGGQVAWPEIEPPRRFGYGIHENDGSFISTLDWCAGGHWTSPPHTQTRIRATA